MGRGVRRHVVICGFAAKQQIAHTSAYEKRLETATAKRFANRIGQIALRHAVIMRQTGPRLEVVVPETIGFWLSAAEDQARNIVGLPCGAYEFVHFFHQVLECLFSAPMGQVADGCVPAFVSEFFSCFIESFDDPIGEENQCVARLHLQIGRLIDNV